MLVSLRKNGHEGSRLFNLRSFVRVFKVLEPTHLPSFSFRMQHTLGHAHDGRGLCATQAKCLSSLQLLACECRQMVGKIGKIQCRMSPVRIK